MSDRVLLAMRRVRVFARLSVLPPLRDVRVGVAGKTRKE